MVRLRTTRQRRYVHPQTEFQPNHDILWCTCNMWSVQTDGVDSNEIVIWFAQHWIEHHDYNYSDIVRWVNENWE